MSAPVFSNHGCRLNAYETEAMKDLARAAGLTDAVVVNTCAVTAEAVRKAKKDIRRLAREHPDAPLIVTGCAAQTDPQAFAAMPEVTRVIGNAEKMDPATWAALTPDLIGATERVQVDDIMSVRETAGHLIDGFGTRSRAYVQVQNGCDHRCTFCIIPYGRGNSRSVPAGVVVDQIKRLVQAGYNEVVLTGVDLTSWGADLPGGPRLIPEHPLDRAEALSLAMGTIADAHPLIVPRIRKYLAEELGADEAQVKAWARHWLIEGQKAYEARLERRPPAPYTFGDTPASATSPSPA